MAKQIGHKFALAIKDFSSLQSQKWDSVPVQIDDCKWSLRADSTGHVFLHVVDFKSLPSGWRRYVKFRLTIVKQVSEEPSVLKDNSYFEAYRWFDQKNFFWGFQSMIPLAKLHDENQGFMVNGQLIIVAEVDILQVIGTSQEYEGTNPPRKLKVECVSSDSERDQDNVVEFRAKNKHLKTACMNVLLSLTQALCQTPQELSIDDLLEAEKTLAYVKDSGIEVDWLEKKLKEVKEKKKKEQSC